MLDLFSISAELLAVMQVLASSLGLLAGAFLLAFPRLCASRR